MLHGGRGKSSEACEAVHEALQEPMHEGQMHGCVGMCIMCYEMQGCAVTSMSFVVFHTYS